MEMHVEGLLAGSLTVCKEKVDPFAPKLRSAQRSCGELSDSEQVRTVLHVQVGEKRGVTTRHDDHVPPHRRLYVHERDSTLVLVDDTDLGLT